MSHQKQKRYHTEHNLDKQLDKMLFLAAEQKLLPKIIYQYSYKHQEPKFVNQYRDSVKQIYTKETATPLVYNEQDAKTHREKFREKIMKLVNNQLPIDYLRPVKVNGKYIMTYKGQPLQKVQYPTKSEFMMFNDYNEMKFRKEIDSIFQDKLQYADGQIFTNNPRKGLAARTRTMPNADNKEKIINNRNTTAPVHQSDTKINNTASNTRPIEHQQHALLPKLVSARSQFDRARLQSPKLNLKKNPKRPKNINQQHLILQRMMRIGKYATMTPTTISITKQSILKYFRQFYPRPHRIIDFLQFSDVETFTTYSKIPQKLKFMPNQHIYFMAFLFYDSNNDGYICHNDLLRLEEVGKKCPLLLDDLQIIRKGAQKIRYENVLPYQDLYRLSEVTETTYFHWLKKQKESSGNPEVDQHKEELKGYFQYLNRRKIMVHYEGFKKIWDNEKPNLWYDLVWRLSGVKYEGLRYE